MNDSQRNITDTDQESRDASLNSPLGVVAATALITSICFIALFIVMIGGQWYSLPWIKDEAITWDGVATLVAACLAGAVAAWVLNIQNKHQITMQNDAIKEQNEQARRQREVQAAADLAQEIDQRWHFYDDVFDLELKFPNMHLSAVQIRDLRRLCNIWVAQLNDDLLNEAGITRGNIGDAVLKFADAIDWAITHCDFKGALSSVDANNQPHDPGKVMSQGHRWLAEVAHYISYMPSVSKDIASQWLRAFVGDGESLGTFMDSRPRKRRPQ